MGVDSQDHTRIVGINIKKTVQNNRTVFLIRQFEKINLLCLLPFYLFR